MKKHIESNIQDTRIIYEPGNKIFQIGRLYVIDSIKYVNVFDSNANSKALLLLLLLLCLFSYKYELKYLELLWNYSKERKQNNFKKK